MKASDFYSLGRRRTKIDYSIYQVGEPVEVPLLGRRPFTAQQTLLQYAKRHNWKLTTKMHDGKLYALREA